MKKILAAILAASLALTLVACGAPAEQTGDEWQLRREKLTQEEVEQAPTEDQLVVLDTACGQIQGIQKDGYQEFRGVRYAPSGVQIFRFRLSSLYAIGTVAAASSA